VQIRPLNRDDEPALSSFFKAIPEADHGFFKEELDDPAVLQRWLTDQRAVRLITVDSDGRFTGLAAVWPGTGRSKHVGDLRIVVVAEQRRRGIGQLLSRRALVEALHRHMSKVMVEVVADQQRTIDMFQQLGFVPEALLRDHLREPSGEYRDVVLLAHAADETWSEMLTAGLDEVQR
jgi:L-amino acid N-acyltransferase YncA